MEGNRCSRADGVSRARRWVYAPPVDKRNRSDVWALAFLLVLGVGAFFARRALGIEWSAESIRTLVDGLGFWGPLLFIALVGFRMLLLIPSQIVLVAGGLCFGVAAGTLYGAIGLTFSGSLVYGIARLAGRDVLLSRLPPNSREILDHVGRRIGPLFIALGTGYPLGPITAYHAGAAFTGMTIPAFLLALVIGATIRSALFTAFGNALVEQGSLNLILAAAAILAVGVIPLLIPRTRQWLLSRMLPSTPDPESDETSV